MKIFILLSFFFSSIACATTKAKEAGQASNSGCQIRAKFLETITDRTSVNRRGVAHPVDLVFWKVNILDVSNAQICPPTGERNIRIRSAMIDAQEGSPKVVYRVGIDEPREKSEIDLKIEFSKGEDSFTKKKFEEWFLKEVGRD
jgi:hypothetical protein